jgi:hypothetical protein
LEEGAFVLLISRYILPSIGAFRRGQETSRKAITIMGIPYDENDGGPPLGPLKKITAGKWSECVYVYVCIRVCVPF